MLDPKDPSTWHLLQEHPSFEEYRFVDEWREWYSGGDPVADLAGYRAIAVPLLQKFPDATAELIVLDDVTSWVRITIGTILADIDLGSEDDTFHVLLDPDPSDMDLEGTVVDNLLPTALVDLIVDYVSQQTPEENK